MNASNFSSKKNPRLICIKIVSWIFQVLIFFCIIANVYVRLAWHYGWPTSLHEQRRMLPSPPVVLVNANGQLTNTLAGSPSRMLVLSHNHLDFFTMSPNNEAPAVYWLEAAQTGLGLCCAIILLRLFWLYRKGIFFTTKNSICIWFFGCYFLFDWAIAYLLQQLDHGAEPDLRRVFIGLLIICIAWIMDEARKIREEQELTV